ncbi:hypothetical protein [Thermotoga sp. SG1]|uniref:hypothetical protein n=1 Tax=Thermotoga sp. SG1 TaxID=126739 RepID=UPI000CB3DA42|nr:hypothetical protein [Thermotoga sp. SG1]PLV56010.1 hypothetical protein AS006_05430 [Thermotoga sp. SG1]
MSVLGIILTVAVVLFIVFLALSEKKREITSDLVCQAVRKHYEKKKYQIVQKTVNGCELFLIKKGVRRLIVAVGNVNFDVVKEILYTAYVNRVRDIRVVYSSITKESQEAFERMRKTFKVHRTKVKSDDIRRFDSVVY